MKINDDDVSHRYLQLASLAAEIVRSLHSEIEKLGFEPTNVTLHSPDEAVYRLERDPANGEDTLVGEWRDERGVRFGELLFHADGSFFVEHDVVKPHPSKKKWFVEAVNAWGRNGTIRAEARLLPLPE